MAASDIKGVGYFRLQRGYEKALEAIDCALEKVRAKGTALEDTLIVLPEAFNIKTCYFSRDKPDINPAICDELADRSQTHGCAFVAGLIIDDTPGVYPCHSSAYLIDGVSTQMLLARKGCKDDAEVSSVREANRDWAPKYTALGSFKSNSIKYRGIALGALICMDAECDGYCEALAKTLHSHDADYTVFCVPARMKSGFMNGCLDVNVFEETSPWRKQRTIQVLANGHTGHLSSFITDAKGKVVRRTERIEQGDIIETMSLEELWTD
jgi:predicted amidohydrolase